MAVNIIRCIMWRRINFFFQNPFTLNFVNLLRYLFNPVYSYYPYSSENIGTPLHRSITWNLVNQYGVQ